MLRHSRRFIKLNLDCKVVIAVKSYCLLGTAYLPTCLAIVVVLLALEQSDNKIVNSSYTSWKINRYVSMWSWLHSSYSRATECRSSV